MFSDHSSKVVEFRSCWRTEKRQKEHASQTSGILTYEAETQTKTPHNVGCQTLSLLELMEASLSNTNKKTQDEHQLLKFLKVVEPIVSKQLKVNVAASNLYTGLFKQRDLETEVEFSCEYILEEDSMISNKESNCIEVTCVSWSSSGAAVAAAYGTNEDIAWSDSRSCLCLWNLDRPKLNRQACDQKLELESSVQVISFHPQFVGFIAAGLFSGVVLIWNLSKDDVIYSSSSHEDPVTCLAWIEDSKYLRLLSSSTDGKIVVWKYRTGRNGATLTDDKQFEVRGANLARRAGCRGAGAVGITCLALGSDHIKNGLISERAFSTNNLLIVGCEAGSVLKCNIDANDLNPVIFTYESHVGPVYSAEWSSFHRHLFLTCSTDQMCRVYHSLQPSPLREIRPEEAVGGKEVNYPFAACWSPTRPLLFYTVGTRGRIEACDISTSKSVAHCDVSNRDGKQCVVNSMLINKNRRNMIATGSSNGMVHILRIGSQLVQTEDSAEEFATFDKLAGEALARD